MNLSHYFLKVPELKVSFATFPFAPFSLKIADAENFSIDFPAEKMLGKQAEYLFENWLKHSQRFQLLAANIQIQGETKTLGELDYVVRAIETNETLHIELACKFYVLDETLGTKVSAQWIGQ